MIPGANRAMAGDSDDHDPLAPPLLCLTTPLADRGDGWLTGNAAFKGHALGPSPVRQPTPAE